MKLIFCVIIATGCAQGSDKIPGQLSGSFGDLQGLSSTEVSPKVVNLLPELIVKSEEFYRAKFLQNEDYAYSRLFLRNEQLKELAKVEKNLASFPSAERHVRWHLSQDQDCAYRKLEKQYKDTFYPGHDDAGCVSSCVCWSVDSIISSLGVISFIGSKLSSRKPLAPEVVKSKMA